MNHVLAWARLGTPIPDVEGALGALGAAGLLGWNVRKAPLKAAVDGKNVTVPDLFAVVRDTAGKPEALGVVGSGYHPIQNEDYAGLLDAIADESGAVFSFAGALDGGRRAFATMRFLGHTDSVDMYLSAVNTHDGSASFQLVATPVHIETQSVLHSEYVFRTRHTVNARQSVTELADIALESTFEYMDKFKALKEKLSNWPMTRPMFDRRILREFGAPASAPAATATRAENKVDAISELFAARQQETAWAGLLALSEWANHFAPVRGGDHDVTRAARAALDPTFKNKALDIMTELGDSLLQA